MMHKLVQLLLPVAGELEKGGEVSHLLVDVSPLHQGQKV